MTHPSFAVRNLGTKTLLLVLGVALLTTAVGVALAAASLSATNAVSHTDNDSSGDVNPGDTLTHTVVIQNNGTEHINNVTYSETLDPNVTQSGSVHVSPIAFDDSYESLGNVGITVPAANGVLLNDADPDGSVALSAVAAAGATAHGTYALDSNGGFSYQPNPGYEGPDSFVYTLTDGDARTPDSTGTVNISVNEVIWFVDSSGAQGNGTLASPFNSLDGAAGYNTIAQDETNDIIFLYSGSYAGGISLLTEQILIGQGATASIAAIAGISVPAFSNALPTTGGARPSITSPNAGVTLAQNNTLRGFNVGDTAVRAITDGGSTVGNLSISEVADTGIGTGIELNNGGTLDVTLDSVNASGGTNGIDLQSTIGSFSVIGTGGANSGGTLSGHSAEGVYLNNTTNVSLSDMVINQSSTSNTQGIDASNVNGLTLVRSTITAGSGSSYALFGSTLTNLNATNTVFDGGGGSVPNIDAVRINNLLGSSVITGSTFRNGKDINLFIENTSTTSAPDTLLITYSSFSNSAGGDHLQVDANNSANLTLAINASAGSNSFTGTSQDAIQLESQGSALLHATVTGATIAGNLGTAVNIGTAGSGTMVARIHNLTGITSGGTNVFNAISFDTSALDVTFENNTINLNGTAANGIRTVQDGNGTLTTRIHNNQVSGQTEERGIYVFAREGTGGSGTLNATVSNNTVGVTGSGSLDGVDVTAGSSTNSDTNTICLNMASNNSTSVGLDGYFLKQRPNATFRLQDFPSGTVQNWVNNTKSNTGTVYTEGSFANAPSACPTPALPNTITTNVTTHVATHVATTTPTTNPDHAADAAHQAAPAIAKTDQQQRTAVAPTDINQSIGTLPIGQSVTLVFDVTINAPTGGTPFSQVCSTGTATGNNGAVSVDTNTVCTGVNTTAVTMTTFGQTPATTRPVFILAAALLGLLTLSTLLLLRRSQQQ